jgi:hypothetical protein
VTWLRKLSFTAHVAVSVGWLGAVAGFLALSIAGMTSHDPETIRGSYLSMNLLGEFVIVPLSLLALATGLIESFASQWGVFRHYWVVAKLVLTVLATGLLMLHQFSAVANAARRVGDLTAAMPTVGAIGTQLLVDASLAILVLLAITALSVFKPIGLTSYGRRSLLERIKAPGQASRLVALESRFGFKILLAVLGTIVVLFVVIHMTGLSGGHMGH